MAKFHPSAPERLARQKPADPIRQVLLVDDHPAFRYGVTRLLANLPGVTVCGESSNADAALAELARLKPDLALVDISMPGGDGIDLVQRMLAEKPDLLVIVVSMHAEASYVLESLRAGARGYVMKEETVGNLLDAVRAVMDGKTYLSPHFSERRVFRVFQGDGESIRHSLAKLSPREKQVFQLLGEGRSTRQIAEAIGISVKTVETYNAKLKEKLGTPTGDELLEFAKEMHLLSRP
jgi:DNA-binding NarL/FixJ family response regulator